MKKQITFLAILLHVSVSAIYGQVGIGTLLPQAQLHVAEGSVVFSTDEESDVFIDPGVLPSIGGSGGTMMWYSGRAAFRIGYYDSRWGAGTIGNGSVAIGYRPEAFGVSSVAMGRLTRARATSSVAMGSSTRAFGYASVAMGSSTLADGDLPCVAMGSFSNAHGRFSTAIGFNTLAHGQYSTAIGLDVQAMSMGEVVIGARNTYRPGFYAQWSNTDRLFVIGNGPSSQSDALTILKNGAVGIGVSTPDVVFKLSVDGDASKTGGGSWIVLSDFRVKKNIVKYKAGLREVLAIRPVRFQYNRLSGYADTTRQYVGVLAQEIEKVLPSTVSITNSDPMVTNKRIYDSSELLYTVINAVKELHGDQEKLSVNNELQSQEVKSLRDAANTEQSRMERIEAMMVRREMSKVAASK